jgi:hypothetical protein
VYFSFNIKRKTLKETPMLLAPVIIMSPFITPYSTHKERPAIKEIISHFETSSVFLVRRDFLIRSTVLHSVKNVANIPMMKIKISLETILLVLEAYLTVLVLGYI